MIKKEYPLKKYQNTVTNSLLCCTILDYIGEQNRNHTNL